MKRHHYIFYWQDDEDGDTYEVPPCELSPAKVPQTQVEENVYLGKHIDSIKQIWLGSQQEQKAMFKLCYSLQRGHRLLLLPLLLLHRGRLLLHPGQ